MRGREVNEHMTIFSSYIFPFSLAPIRLCFFRAHFQPVLCRSEIKEVPLSIWFLFYFCFLPVASVKTTTLPTPASVAEAAALSPAVTTATTTAAVRTRQQDGGKVDTTMTSRPVTVTAADYETTTIATTTSLASTTKSSAVSTRVATAAMSSSQISSGAVTASATASTAPRPTSGWTPQSVATPNVTSLVKSTVAPANGSHGTPATEMSSSSNALVGCLSSGFVVSVAVALYVFKSRQVKMRAAYNMDGVADDKSTELGRPSNFSMHTVGNTSSSVKDFDTCSAYTYTDEHRSKGVVSASSSINQQQASGATRLSEKLVEHAPRETRSFLDQPEIANQVERDSWADLEQTDYAQTNTVMGLRSRDTSAELRSSGCDYDMYTVPDYSLPGVEEPEVAPAMSVEPGLLGRGAEQQPTTCAGQSTDYACPSTTGVEYECTDVALTSHAYPSQSLCPSSSLSPAALVRCQSASVRQNAPVARKTSEPSRRLNAISEVRATAGGVQHPEAVADVCHLATTSQSAAGVYTDVLYPRIAVKASVPRDGFVTVENCYNASVHSKPWSRGCAPVSLLAGRTMSWSGPVSPRLAPQEPNADGCYNASSHPKLDALLQPSEPKGAALGSRTQSNASRYSATDTGSYTNPYVDQHGSGIRLPREGTMPEWPLGGPQEGYDSAAWNKATAPPIKCPSPSRSPGSSPRLAVTLEQLSDGKSLATIGSPQSPTVNAYFCLSMAGDAQTQLS